MFTFDEPLNVNSVNSSFMKREQPRWRMKEVWFTLNESSTVNFVNRTCHCKFLRLEEGEFRLLLLGFLFCYSVWKYCTLVLKWKYGHAPLVLDFMIGRVCFFERKQTVRDNAQHEIVQELNFPVVTLEDVKFKRQNNWYQACCWASEVLK
jgi:hypothetical protein